MQKTALDLMHDENTLRAGKQAEIDRLKERRRSLVAEMTQNDEKIATLEYQVRGHEAKVSLYAMEHAKASKQ